VVFLCHEYACSQTGQPVFSFVLFFFCLSVFIHIFVSSRWSDWDKNDCHLISFVTKIFQYLNTMNKCFVFAVLRNELFFGKPYCKCDRLLVLEFFQQIDPVVIPMLRIKQCDKFCRFLTYSFTNYIAQTKTRKKFVVFLSCLFVK